MIDSEQITESQPQRLCSEIQLFDLCDLGICRYKTGRFCSNTDLLSRFEKIAEEELRVQERYISEEDEDNEGDDGSEYADDRDEDELDGDVDVDHDMNY